MPLLTAIITPLEAVRTFAIAITCVYLLFVVLNEAYNDAARNPAKRRRKFTKAERRTIELDFGIIPVPLEIIALTHNKETAYRLYDNLREGYPHQSDEWIWDKVKWDIIRDRH